MSYETPSLFGDWEPDDAIDHEPADPEQVAAFRARLERERIPADQVAARIAAWLHEQGADE